MRDYWLIIYKCALHWCLNFWTFRHQWCFGEKVHYLWSLKGSISGRNVESESLPQRLQRFEQGFRKGEVWRKRSRWYVSTSSTRICPGRGGDISQYSFVNMLFWISAKFTEGTKGQGEATEEERGKYSFVNMLFYKSLDNIEASGLVWGSNVFSGHKICSSLAIYHVFLTWGGYLA